MPKVRDDIKAKLKASGRWDEFVLRRASLRLSGRTSEAAHREALAEFVEPDRKTGADNGGNPAVFQGRGARASFADQAIWVAQNMDNPDPHRVDCPDPAAWSMLMACKESPTFKTSFWTSVYTRVMLAMMKAEENKQDEESDRGICDLCSELDRALGEEAQS